METYFKFDGNFYELMKKYDVAFEDGSTLTGAYFYMTDAGIGLKHQYLRIDIKYISENSLSKITETKL